ncbi:MAG TPA: DapH/DapD/GlmU-related protein, partial [Dehalococcoidia bacterium]|nr:DapH/DapD/GlmU-related protein [Dehalococcoidia bacterium]
MGARTRVWNHAQIREGAVIGDDCVIGKGVYIDRDVVIGRAVKVQNY